MQPGENPRAALDALLPAPVPIEGTGENVKPFSLALYAMLDRIRSPLLYGGTGADALSVLPSLFIACRGVDEGLKPELLRRSLEWADALPPSALPALRDAVAKQVNALLAVTPETKKKADAGPTDG